MTPVTERFFAPCPRGLEPVLAAELAALGAGDVAATDGGAAFTGPLALAYRANLESRVASRVLWRVAGGAYRDEHDVYRITHAVDWTRRFAVERTIRVNVSAIRSPLKSLDFATLRIKDGVCDRFRDVTGRRPSVDTAAPDVRIHAFLTDRELTLYLDTSGEPLFKRGWRTAAVEAPLRENLAAGILRLAGWTPGTPLLDPMCGSGTFLAEAALIALDRAPGLGRRFAFEQLAGFERRAWESLLQAAQSRVRKPQALGIHGADRDARAIAAARENLQVLGLAGAVTLERADVLELAPPAPAGILVTNPPYGVRLEDRERLAAFYPRLGDALKQRFAGWTAWLLSADMDLPKKIGLKASRRTPLYNGALECRLFEYRLVAGRLPPRRDPQEESQ